MPMITPTRSHLLVVVCCTLTSVPMRNGWRVRECALSRCSCCACTRLRRASYSFAVFCHLSENAALCAGTADRSGCPNSICAGDRPPSRGVFRYSRRPRWNFSSSSSLTVDVAMSFFIAFTAVKARPLDWGLCDVGNTVLTPQRFRNCLNSREAN